MFKKCCALLVVAILCCNALCPVFAASVDDGVSDASTNIVYFTDFDELSVNNNAIGTIVPTCQNN